MSVLTEIITADAPDVRNRSLDSFCREASTEQLVVECEALDAFQRQSENLYERVRAQFFLYAIYRFHLGERSEVKPVGEIPYAAHVYLLQRRFDEAIQRLMQARDSEGMSASLASAFAVAYHGLAFQTLANQVRRSVRSVRGNQWMSRIAHPADDPLKIRQELKTRSGDGLFPILRETTPVRMDLTHSGWSDIFFLAMDFPEAARVINTSINLSLRGSGTPQPPVEAYLRVIDEPVLRLTSVDLNATADLTSFAEVFDFAKDYLGLLKAAVIASGLVPLAMEGAHQPLSDLLARLTGQANWGIEIVSRVRDIPKGSRLAVSTNLLACLISVCMRATGQVESLTGALAEADRRLVAARAILGEWLGGSGGGWQDSGGVWPGIKLIAGVGAREGDPEEGISRGCLLPSHHVFSLAEVTEETRQKLQDSLVLVHGGMAQDVGPILEMVTERYLLRSEAEWQGRQEALRILDDILDCLNRGDIAGIGAATERNFTGPIQTIIPWASNYYTERLIASVRQKYGAGFWGFWMLGGMAGGGMGFLFDPAVKRQAQDELQELMRETKREIQHAVPFAMDPVVYDFTINEHGTWADWLEGDRALMPTAYYTQILPTLLRREARHLTASRRSELDRFGIACRQDPAMAGVVQNLFEHLLPRASDEERGPGASLAGLLEEYGFDRLQHEQIQADLRHGRLGLAQNRLPSTNLVENVRPENVLDTTSRSTAQYDELGYAALREGKVAVVTLAGGVGSRWTRGAGVVKAANPFCKMDGRYRTFIEVHLAKSRRTSREAGTAVPHVITTSYLTHEAIADWLARENNYRYQGPLYLSSGRSIGLRIVPMVRDLRYAWEEMPQQVLDEQKQKMRESAHAALINWAQQAGEGSDYTDNSPEQCLHPIGHWYEVPNLLRNGTLARLLQERPQLRYLMVHNIDTLGAHLDPGLLGYHIEQGAGMTTEVITRHLEDRGGGLACIDGRIRLLEGLASPSEEAESSLSYYNSATYWIDIDQLLDLFGLTREQLRDEGQVLTAIRTLAARMPTYVTIKDVKKRWGKGQEDIFPVMQWEKLWGDLTALPELKTRFAVVPRRRGQQLKEPAQLDGWWRDQSAAYVAGLCEWE